MPFLVVWRRLSKGNQVNIPEPEFLVVVVTQLLERRQQCLCVRISICGNATELGDTGRGPGKSFLFFLTRTPQPSHKDPEIRLPGARVFGAVKHSTISRVSGAPLTVLENPREISHL